MPVIVFFETGTEVTTATAAMLTLPGPLTVLEEAV